MRKNAALVLMFIVVASACSDQAGFDKEIEICITAERNGLLEVAVEACGLALNVANSGNFPPAVQSQTLYRLGRLNRLQGNYEKAEELINRSLEIEAQLDKASALETGYRLVELSLCLAGQKRWSDGVPILERLIPMAAGFSEKDRIELANILKQYSFQLNKAGRPELADRLAIKATALKK